MKGYGFTVTRSVIVKGYLSADNEAEAREKILAGEWDNIIDETGTGDIDDVIEVWEAN